MQPTAVFDQPECIRTNGRIERNRLQGGERERETETEGYGAKAGSWGSEKPFAGTEKGSDGGQTEGRVCKGQCIEAVPVPLLDWGKVQRRCDGRAGGGEACPSNGGGQRGT